jgi:hypothetical protein
VSGAIFKRFTRKWGDYLKIYKIFSGRSERCGIIATDRNDLQQWDAIVGTLLRFAFAPGSVCKKLQRMQKNFQF